MIFKKVVDTFNPYTPMSLNEFWKQQVWVFIWGVICGVLGIILEKNGAGIEMLLLIGVFYVGGPAYIEFIFAVKRFRYKHIPPVWASLIFIPPLSLIIFVIAASKDNDAFTMYIKDKFTFKGDNYV